jgi:hypothetical protein
LIIDINDNSKIVALWFSSEENPKQNIPKDIEEEIEKYRKQKYRICMYQSGTDDIKKNLLNLLINNAY